MRGQGQGPFNRSRRGIARSLDDRLRRDAIKQILCHFRLDPERPRAAYGDVAGPLAATAADLLLARAPEGALQPWRGGFVVAEGRRSHTRLIAAEFDAWLNPAPARRRLAV